VHHENLRPVRGDRRERVVQVTAWLELLHRNRRGHQAHPANLPTVTLRDQVMNRLDRHAAAE
jgi:hypothetical protein